MELMAVIVALQACEESSSILLSTDSMYVINGCRELREKWHLEGKLRRGPKAVKNLDLWVRLWYEQSRHFVMWRWVRGHTGDVQNEICDTESRP